MTFEDSLVWIQTLMVSNKYLAAGITLVVFFILSKLFVMIIEKIVMRLVKKTETEVDDKIVEASRNPMSLLILLVGVKIFVIQLWANQWFIDHLDNAIDSFIVVVVAFTLIKIIDIILQGWGAAIAKRTKSHIDDQLVKLAHQFALVILYILAFLFILHLWGIQIGPLLAGLGIGGLAIAFALQPTLANIFGGITLILDKAIKVDDIVQLESGESGRVYDIGLRSTRIKTWNNEILIVPNAKLVDSMVQNYDQPDRRIRLDILFGVEYGTKIDKVKKLALNTLKKEKHILKDPAPAIWFTEMADSSLNFKLMFWIDDIGNKWDTHQRIITKLYDDLNKAKIGIPFPQRELWVHNLKK